MRLLLLAALALAGDPHVETFDDPSLDGWERVVSEAHPPYNTIETLRSSLHLVTMGGSTSIRRLPTRSWPVSADQPYRVSIGARLVGTRRNTASIALVWLDASGRTLSETRSSALAGPCERTPIVLEIPGPPAGAAAVAPRIDFSGDDVRGEAFFDQLRFEPIELLDVRPAGRSVAIFAPEEYPRFTASLAGSPAGTQTITFVLRSTSGAELRRTASIATPSDEPVAVDFRALPVGAYELTASVDGRGAVRRRTVLVAPGARPGVDLRAWAGLPSTGHPGLDAVLRHRLALPFDAEGLPTAALLGRRTANEVLADAAPLPDPGLFPEPVRTAAFRKGATATLALWSDGAETDLSLSLNPDAVVHPLLGPSHPLLPGGKLRLGPLPVFLTGVDPLLLEMRVDLPGGDLPLQIGAVVRPLRFRNPSKSRPMSDVRIRLEDVPPGWRVSPRSVAVPALAPDAELAEDLQITLPSGESEGTRDLKFEIAFTRDGKEHVVHLIRSITLRAALAIESAVADGPKPGSRVVTIRVRNGSDRPMTLALRARLPNLPEQNELLRPLAPGAVSPTFEYVVKDVPLLDPTRASAEIEVQESLGARAGARKTVPLR